MATESGSTGSSSQRVWPADVEPYYRPTLVAAVVAGTCIAAGSVGTWANVLLFSIGGLDFENWGSATLLLGVIATFALIVVLFWSRIPLDPRWALVLAWLTAICGVTCLTDAVINIARLTAVPKGDFFGVPIGVSAGWGLWLVAISSATLAATGTVIATQVGRSDDLHQRVGQESDRWIYSCRRGALAIAAIIVVAGVIYAVENPLNAAPNDNNSLASGLPSLRNLQSTPASPTNSSLTSSARPAVPPAVYAPALDGTYRQDIDEVGITTDGKSDPRSDTDPHWFAFRYACTTAGCVASGSYVDPRKLGLPQQHSTAGMVFHWLRDHWQYSSTYKNDCSGPNGDAQEEKSNVWVFAAQPDGFYSGVDGN